jgi:hypothetical protein
MFKIPEFKLHLQLESMILKFHSGWLFLSVIGYTPQLT